MTTEDRLAYEARVRNRQAGVAAAAGILVMIGVVIQLGGPHVNVNEKTLGLITEHKRFTRDLLGSIATAFSLLAWAGPCTTCGTRLEPASRTRSRGSSDGSRSRGR